jgi:hypothetical protein
VISNVVLMGMGEPLANLDNTVTALRLMLDDNAYGLSRRRVTVSTSGLVPAMDRLRDECAWRWRFPCTRRMTACAINWCRSTGNTLCASCWPPAGATSRRRRGLRHLRVRDA